MEELFAKVKNILADPEAATWLAVGFAGQALFLCVSLFNGSTVNDSAGASYRSHFGTSALEEALHY